MKQRSKTWKYGAPYNKWISRNGFCNHLPLYQPRLNSKIIAPLTFQCMELPRGGDFIVEEFTDTPAVIAIKHPLSNMTLPIYWRTYSSLSCASIFGVSEYNQSLIPHEVKNIMSDTIELLNAHDVMAARAYTGYVRIHEHWAIHKLSNHIQQFKIHPSDVSFCIVEIYQYLTRLGLHMETYQSNIAGNIETINGYMYESHKEYEIITTCISASISNDSIDISLVWVDDYPKVRNETLDFFKGITHTITNINTQILTGFNDSGPVFSSRKISILDSIISNVGVEYPYIDGVSATLTAFDESNSNLLLLIGTPGTGKTSLIRHALCNELKHRNSIYVTSVNVIRDPRFESYLTTLNDDDVLIMEDVDELLNARCDGNTTMSTILNVLNGVVPSKAKFLISSNLDNLGSVDDALVRAGRLFKAITFRKLDPTEVKVLADKHPQVKPNITGDQQTLADLFADQPNSKVKKSIGFCA